MVARIVARMLTANDVKILETAELLEGRIGNGAALINDRHHMRPPRFGQLLMHLVIQPDVLRDPRWTMLAYRIQEAAHGAQIAREQRTFRKAS